ncbi:MAG: glutamate-5-semialdehyde dehydrogenase [Acidobacteria bacterium]|nr:glutamate-5-semialdehyde dehydrogenase [Acidobacteriota bacterium]
MSASTSKLATKSAGSLQASVAEIAGRARAASRLLAKLSNPQRNEVLQAVADAIEKAMAHVLAANAEDCRAAEPAVRSGDMTAAMLARLGDQRKLAHMASYVRSVASLPDPLGKRLTATELDDGLTLYKETCPLGVIGVVFESRPEVISQVAALTLKSGNAVILKGGSEAVRTNDAIVSVWRDGLGQFPAVPADAIQLLRTREEFTELLSRDRDVDLIVPRGSYELVHFVMRNSRIPVLGHGEGICHVYVDAAADLDKAVAVTFDAKVQGPAICNAAETLLVHRAVAKQFLPQVAAKLVEAGVEIRGCPETMALLAGIPVVPATEKDWATEYCDLILSVKVVADEDEAIAHINQYGSRHTDAIVTEDSEAARKFMDEVDSAGVFQNASTRFSDGYNYGLGAEIGISNSKLHARGPMGLEGLTTYKYKLFGNGHTVAEYSKGLRHFKHRPLA